MQLQTTLIEDVKLILLDRKEDERGAFTRTFCVKELTSLLHREEIVQMNYSENLKKHTLRGMHYQKDSNENKFVHCVNGVIYDVVLDLRKDSKTYLKWSSFNLKSNYLLYIPQGCAHGFLSLYDNTNIMYYLTDFFNPQKYAGVRWNDPAFNIEWPYTPKVISDKDASYEDYK